MRPLWNLIAHFCSISEHRRRAFFQILTFHAGFIIFRPHIFNGVGKSRSVMRFFQILP